LTALACAAAPAIPPAATVNLVLLGDRQAHRLRVDIQIDGRALAAVWEKTLASLFADLDRDGDGVLNRAEAGRAPSALRIRQLAWPAYLFAAPVAAPWEELDVAPTDGKVNREEFIAYYRRHGVGAVQIGVGKAPPANLLTDALLKHLDRDGDGRVSQAEWQAAEVALRPLDLDDDELIRPSELVARTPYPGTFGSLMLTPPLAGKPHPKLLDGFPVLRVPDDAADRVWESQLGGRSTPPAEPKETLTVRLGSKIAPPAVERHGYRGPADAAQVDFADGLRLTLYTVPGRMPGDFEIARKLAITRFNEADRDRDGFVTKAEADQSNYAPLRDHFAFADRDADGRVSREEWNAYLGLRERLAGSQVVWTIWDHGHGLFEMLDADADGALSIRELRDAWRHLDEAGCLKGGVLDRTKLPRQVRMAVSLGSPKSLLRSPPRRGPAWFRAMDRNGDGDVSRREFAGTDADFRRLDADGDGLISPDEAERAKPKP
jgi:hypothetical protein